MPYQYSGAPTLSDLIGQANDSATQMQTNADIQIKQKQQLADFLLKGVSPDASGLNARGAAAQEAEMAGNQHTTAKYDPNSQVSQSVQKAAQSINKKFNPHADFSGVTAADMPEINGQAEAGIKAGGEINSAAVKNSTGITKNEESAIQKMNSEYNKHLPKLSGALAKIKSAVSAVNDPQQAGSSGAAKSMILGALAEMNRYNATEGADYVPSSWLQKAAQFANSLSDDKTNPFDQGQRQAVNSLFAEGLQGVKMKHDIAKKAALSHYTNSRFADPGRAAQFQSNLGNDLDNQINDVGEVISNVPKTSQYQNPGQPVPQQPTGVINKLKGFFMGGNQQPSQSPPQDPAARLKYLQDKKAGRVQ